MTEKPKKKRSYAEKFYRPKGMRDIIGDTFYAYQGFFEKASEVASYYGFKPIETPILEKEEVFTSGVGKDTDIIQKEMYSLKTKGGVSLVIRPEGTAGIVRAYVENGLHTKPQPVMFYYYGPYFRHEKPQKGRWRQFYQFGLETLGTDKSIADAITIRVTMIVIEEAGINNLFVRINSIGDKVCRPAYIKELISYYRKHINDICPHCRDRMKNNPLRLLDCKSEDCQKIKEGAPEMISYLCDPCKKHFKEVLEYLDTTETSYTIDHTLVRGIDYYTRTVFEVVSDRGVDEKPEQSKEEEEEDKKTKKVEVEVKKELVALAGGGRYDNLARKFGSKRDVPAVGVGIGVDRIIELPDFHAHPPRIIKKPKAYFIQIGVEAKLKSLEVIEILRKTKTPVFHALNKDTLSTQLAMAEKMNIPYTIILGQREVLENTVIVRDMESHSQSTVKIENLAEYLKKK